MMVCILKSVCNNKNIEYEISSHTYNSVFHGRSFFRPGTGGKT